MTYGIENGVLRGPARVLMYLPEGWTKILLLLPGNFNWDIPTAQIPEHLRPIGSIFVVETRVPDIWIENSEERYQRRFEDLKVTELPEEELSQYSSLNHSYQIYR